MGGDSAGTGPPALVIFDCDGVLVDSERLLVPIDAAILGELGWAITEEEVVRRFLGRSAEECDRDIEAHLGRPIPPEVADEVARRYEEAFRTSLQPVPGVVAALDALEARSVATCVASSSTHERLRLMLGLTGLLDRFEGRIFSATDVARGKPEPDLFLFAAESMGVAPPDCVVVEDSPYGLRAARAAGMPAVAFAGGLVPRERLELDGATLVDDMSELTGLLLGEAEADAEAERQPEQQG